VIRTDRLVLRRWTDADLPAFAAMNADPLVMKPRYATEAAFRSSRVNAAAVAPCSIRIRTEA
jgi:RimJ/RimL family protein N-acetyltransferase